MDGVLIDSESWYIKQELNLLKSLGINTTEEVTREYIGISFEKTIPELAKRYNKIIPIKKALEKYDELITELYTNQTKLIPNVIKVLEKLRKKYPFGLATSSPRYLAKLPLKRFSLNKYFKAKTFGDEIKNGKPSPEIFLQTAKNLNVDPKNILVIEDSFNGTKAAKAAGMKLIAFKTNHNQNLDFSLADFVTEDLREIPKILKILNNNMYKKTHVR